MTTFTPEKHLTKLPRWTKDEYGNSVKVEDDYLEVKWRLVWFRDRYPNGTIETEEMYVDLDREVTVEKTRWVNKKKEFYTVTAIGYARYKATVCTGEGGRATGTKTETAVDFPDFCEKAETGAIGRALAALGFGTQFTGDEFNEAHRIVDAPVKHEGGTEQAQDAPVPFVSKKEQDGAITAQQVKSIQNLCKLLGKEEPKGLDDFSNDHAKEVITTLGKELSTKRQQKAS